MSGSDNIVCEGGPRHGYWYTTKTWEENVKAATFDQRTKAAAGEPPITGDRTLGYKITRETRGHPRLPGQTGTVARWEGA